MNNNPASQFESFVPPQKQLGPFPREHMVALYTMLSILTRMKCELGLEAMLEYMAKYITVIDSHNPKIASAVTKALQLIPIEGIYNELGKSNNNS